MTSYLTSWKKRLFSLFLPTATHILFLVLNIILEWAPKAGVNLSFFGRARLTKNSRQAVECADEMSRPIQVFKNNFRSLDTVYFGWLAHGPSQQKCSVYAWQPERSFGTTFNERSLRICTTKHGTSLKSTSTEFAWQGTDGHALNLCLLGIISKNGVRR